MTRLPPISVPHDLTNYERSQMVLDGADCITLRSGPETYVIVEQAEGWLVTHIVANGRKAETKEFRVASLPGWYKPDRRKGKQPTAPMLLTEFIDAAHGQAKRDIWEIVADAQRYIQRRS